MSRPDHDFSEPISLREIKEDLSNSTGCCCWLLILALVFGGWLIGFASIISQ